MEVFFTSLSGVRKIGEQYKLPIINSLSEF